MSVPAAYLGVVLIWATTPLAIKWSGEEIGFLLGVSLRMIVGYVICLVLLGIMRIEFPWHAKARQAYLAAGLGMFGSILSVYWAAQYIPSGLISVIYGLSPIFVGSLAYFWLGDYRFSAGNLLGVAMGIAGLWFIFMPQDAFTDIAPQGVLAVLFSVFLHAISAVWLKRIGGELHPMTVNSGALTIAVPLYLLMWWWFDGHWPAAMSERSLGAILYLAVLGTALGFNLYFFLLKRVSAAAVSLGTLISPVLALLIGQVLNDEVITLQVWLGTAAILMGLFSYQWGGKTIKLLRRSVAGM